MVKICRIQPGQHACLNWTQSGKAAIKQSLCLRTLCCRYDYSMIDCHLNSTVQRMFSFKNHRKKTEPGPGSLLAVLHVLIPRSESLHGPQQNSPPLLGLQHPPRPRSHTQAQCVRSDYTERKHTYFAWLETKTGSSVRDPNTAGESLCTHRKEAKAVKLGSSIHSHTEHIFMGADIQLQINTHAQMHNQQYRNRVSCCAGILYILCWLPLSADEREYPHLCSPGPGWPRVQKFIRGHFLHNHSCFPLI